MAKGKYQRWLEPDGLLLLEGWAWARHLGVSDSDTEGDHGL